MEIGVVELKSSLGEQLPWHQSKVGVFSPLCLVA